MKYSSLFITILFIHITLNAQVDTTSFNYFLVLIEGNYLKVENAEGEVIYKKLFHRPYQYLADIDADQFDELVVVDSISTADNIDFVLYLYSGEEDFMLIDSIYSGSFFPFITYSEEIDSLIIETGIPEFEIFNQSNETASLPINLWRVKDNRLYLVNDELYEPFIFENSNLIQLLDFYTHDKIIDCSTSQLCKGLIASVFINYINGGEQSLATQTLKKYYVCDDIEEFKQEILHLIYPKAQ